MLHKLLRRFMPDAHKMAEIKGNRAAIDQLICVSGFWETVFLLSVKKQLKKEAARRARDEVMATTMANMINPPKKETNAGAAMTFANLSQAQLDAFRKHLVDSQNQPMKPIQGIIGKYYAPIAAEYVDKFQNKTE